MSRSKNKKNIPRNGSALAAMSRKSGNAPMKHRLEPKQGTKNEQSEIINSIDEYQIPNDQCRYCFIFESEINDTGSNSKYCFLSPDDAHHFGETNIETENSE